MCCNEDMHCPDRQKNPRADAEAPMISGDDIGHLVNMVSHQLKRRAQDNCETPDLTNMQSRVMGYIHRRSEEHEVYQRDVEKEFQIRRSTATEVLSRLEKNGYIHRESVEHDKRLKKLVPTPKADAVRDAIVRNVIHTEEVLKSGISEEDLRVCAAALRKMSANLTAQEKKVNVPTDM